METGGLPVKGAYCLMLRTRSAAAGSFIFSRNSEKDNGCVAIARLPSSVMIGWRQAHRLLGHLAV